MAYNKMSNPDALPAHAEPSQAAQALADLPGNRRPSPHRPVAQSPLNPNLPPNRRVSPAGLPGQQAYYPSPGPTNSQYQTQQKYHQPQNLYQQPQNSHQQTPPPPYTTTSIQSRIYSPPPADYGYGPRPQPPPKPEYDRRPSDPSATTTPTNTYYPPRTPRPPSPDSAALYPLFLRANTSQTGSLTSTELSSALVNADYTSFDPHTIRTMMRLFSSHPTYSTITYPEFQNLWRFLAAWRELFERFDEDASGRISLSEFSKALVAFGYRLSQPFVGLLYNTFNDKGMERRGSGGVGMGPARGQGMSFDLFVQACISLKRMTDVFKGYDDDRDGYVTLSFEEFLTEILRLRE